MGPFPHNAPRATISNENPAGTDGFEFVEFAHPEPSALRDSFSKMGFTHVANHKSKKIELKPWGNTLPVSSAIENRQSIESRNPRQQRNHTNHSFTT